MKRKKYNITSISVEFVQVFIAALNTTKCFPVKMIISKKLTQPIKFFDYKRILSYDGF